MLTCMIQCRPNKVFGLGLGVRAFYACIKLAVIQSNIYFATKLAMKEMAWIGCMQTGSEDIRG